MCDRACKLTDRFHLLRLLQLCFRGSSSCDIDLHANELCDATAVIMNWCQQQLIPERRAVLAIVQQLNRTGTCIANCITNFGHSERVCVLALQKSAVLTFNFTGGITRNQFKTAIHVDNRIVGLRGVCDDNPLSDRLNRVILHSQRFFCLHSVSQISCDRKECRDLPCRISQWRCVRLQPATAAFEAHDFILQHAGLAKKHALDEVAKVLSILFNKQRIHILILDLLERVRFNHCQAGLIHIQQTPLLIEQLHTFRLCIQDGSQMDFARRQLSLRLAAVGNVHQCETALIAIVGSRGLNADDDWQIVC